METENTNQQTNQAQTTLGSQPAQSIINNQKDNSVPSVLIMHLKKMLKKIITGCL